MSTSCGKHLVCLALRAKRWGSRCCSVGGDGGGGGDGTGSQNVHRYFLPACLPACLPCLCRPVGLHVGLTACLPACLPACLQVCFVRCAACYVACCLPACPSACLLSEYVSRRHRHYPLFMLLFFVSVLFVSSTRQWRSRFFFVLTINSLAFPLSGSGDDFFPTPLT